VQCDVAAQSSYLLAAAGARSRAPLASHLASFPRWARAEQAARSTTISPVVNYLVHILAKELLLDRVEEIYFYKHSRI
jgi:hypothetical protein